MDGTSVFPVPDYPLWLPLPITPEAKQQGCTIGENGWHEHERVPRVRKPPASLFPTGLQLLARKIPYSCLRGVRLGKMDGTSVFPVPDYPLWLPLPITPEAGQQKAPGKPASDRLTTPGKGLGTVISAHLGELPQKFRKYRTPASGVYGWGKWMARACSPCPRYHCVVPSTPDPMIEDSN
ncbi:hypothetical protein niasHT_011649 [Heterodera trifolii]|uniref:Uncharacterized protein n=1 Tax=Heterodera trifolii TaxID=157864 RepID=A0ABD2LIM8_9BILA